MLDGQSDSEDMSVVPAAESRGQKPETTAAPSPQPAATEPKPARSFPKRALFGLLGLLILGAAGYYGQYWWTTGRYFVSTDDAYVGARSSTLSPKVSGYISEVAVDDNAHVKAGDIIARIDSGDYRIAVQSAKDQIAVQKATIDRFGRQVVAQQAAVEQAKAQQASAQAGETRADLDLKRQLELAARQVNSKQSLDQAQATYDQAVAAVQAAKAGVQSAEANVDVLKAQQEEARRTLSQLETSLAKAERDLSFTIIRAPFDGVVGNRAMQVGDYVQPTQRLASLVPLDAVYVDANFKETQIAKLQAGQPVSITVDALPGRKFEGQVASFAPASGSVFSLLPPDNATGNFTKIVQRLPVRILVPAEIADQSVLRPGMSVVVNVNTKAGAAVAEQRMNAVAVRTNAAANAN